MRKKEIVAVVLKAKKELGLKAADLIVNAGSAMVLYGLRDETEDVDATTSEDNWFRVHQENPDLFVRVIPRGVYSDNYTHLIECRGNLDLHFYQNGERPVTMIVEGIHVEHPKVILERKKFSNREKDQEDIIRLKEYLKMS